MERASEEAKKLGDGTSQVSNAGRPAWRRLRTSRVAGALAVAILLVMLVGYVVSMYAGGMEHSVSGDTTLPQDVVTTGVTAPVADGQMVMSDGSVMGVDEHPAEIAGTAVTEADPHAAAPAEAGHQMDMGGGINWYVIGGILALVAAIVAAVAGLKERLARAVAPGAPASEGVSGE